MNFGDYGSTIAGFNNQANPLRMELAARCSIVVPEASINDITGGTSADTVMARLATALATVNADGAKHVLYLTSPPAGGVDASTSATTNSVRVDVNSGKLARANNTTVFCADIGPVAEKNGVGSGQWVDSYITSVNPTTHPNGTGFDALASSAVWTPIKTALTLQS